MAYLIRRPGESWKQPSVSTYDNEAELQALLAAEPSLIPGDARIAVAREFWVPGVGSVDLVGVTAGGEIVVVECKLRANPQIRREVVGQALAYAGGLWRMTAADFVAEFEHKTGSPLDNTLHRLGTDDVTAARLQIEDSLRTGDFRVVIAVDEITSELRTIVEYVNGHTVGLEVILLELDYTKDDDVEILVPTTYGLETATAKSAVGSGTKAANWTLTTIRASVSERSSADGAALIERLIAHGVENAHHLYFGSGATPGMAARYNLNGEPTPVWALYVYEDKQLLSPSIGAVAKRSPELAITYLQQLRTRPALSAHLMGIDPDNMNKLPNIPVSDLTNDDISLWITAIDEMIAE